MTPDSTAPRSPVPALDRLMELHKATTRGEWESKGNTFWIGPAYWSMPGQIPDATFIAAAHNDLPSIAEQVGRLVERERRLESAVKLAIIGIETATKLGSSKSHGLVEIHKKLLAALETPPCQ